MKQKVDEILDDIKIHLEYQKMMGNTEMPKKSPLLCKEGKGEVDIYPTHPPLTKGRSNALDDIRAEIGNCKRCKLCNGRTNIVFGVGSPHAELMFIGEGPGADEDAQGIPFVGRAGQLLTKIIIAMGFKRDDVYISNVIMCRPPNNRNPEPDEIEACLPFSLKRIEAIGPKIIVCLGAIAAKALLKTEVPISKLRGKLIDWNTEMAKPWSTANSANPLFAAQEGKKADHQSNIKLVPTYHPAFLLRNPNMKKPVWEDMQKVMAELKNLISV